MLCTVEPGAFVSPSGSCPLQLWPGRAVGKKGSFEWGLVGEKAPESTGEAGVFHLQGQSRDFENLEPPLGLVLILTTVWPCCSVS